MVSILAISVYKCTLAWPLVALVALAAYPFPSRCCNWGAELKAMRSVLPIWLNIAMTTCCCNDKGEEYTQTAQRKKKDRAGPEVKQRACSGTTHTHARAHARTHVGDAGSTTQPL